MTIGQDDAAAPSAPVAAEPKPNGFQRVIGVLTAPNETFASIARRPDFLAPLLLLLIVSIIGGVLVAQRVDFTAPAREAIEQNKNISAEQAERMIKMSGGIAKVLTFLSPVLMIISLLIMAGVLLIAFRLFGGEGDFRQAFAVSTYASMPSLIKSIFTIIILIAKGGALVPAQLLPTLVRSNLSFLVEMKTNPVLFALLAQLDIFTIWLLALLVIGFSYVARVSKAKSAAIVVSLWIVVSLLKLIGPAMQSLRASR